MDPLIVAATGAVGVVVAVLIATAASEDYHITLRRSALIALCMIALVAMVALALDMRELRRTLPHAPKLFVLKDGNLLIAAFVANGTDEVHPVWDMSRIREGAQRGGIAGVHDPGSYYRTFFVGRAATENMIGAYRYDDRYQVFDARPSLMTESIVTGSEPIEILNVTVPRETALAYLYLRDPSASFLDWYAREREIPAYHRDALEAQFRAIVPTDDYFRSVLFAKLAEPRLRGTRWLTLYREGHVEVYPMSMMFHFMGFMPPWFTDLMMPEG